jgi:hypothetical protein
LQSFVKSNLPCFIVATYKVFYSNQPLFLIQM